MKKVYKYFFFFVMCLGILTQGMVSSSYAEEQSHIHSQGNVGFYGTYESETSTDQTAETSESGSSEKGEQQSSDKSKTSNGNEGTNETSADQEIVVSGDERSEENGQENSESNANEGMEKDSQEVEAIANEDTENGNQQASSREETSDGDTTSSGFLPKTGEKDNVYLFMIGMAILLMILLLAIIKGVREMKKRR